MIQQFAAGSMVAAIFVALAALILLLIPTLTVQRMSPLITLWCFAPAAWGLWALIAPKAWVPQRLPLWGAILGLIAGMMAAFVLNLPLRVFGELIPVWLRGMGCLFIVAFYFLMWMLVRAAYRSLSSAPMDV
jgi:hypothetical protein